MSYEQKGECFFIPFGSEDVDGEYSPNIGDEIYFYIATDKRYKRICSISGIGQLWFSSVINESN